MIIVHNNTLSTIQVLALIEHHSFQILLMHIVIFNTFRTLTEPKVSKYNV